MKAHSTVANKSKIERVLEGAKKDRGVALREEARAVAKHDDESSMALMFVMDL